MDVNEVVRIGARFSCAIIVMLLSITVAASTEEIPERRANSHDAVFSAMLERKTIGLGQRMVLRLSLEGPKNLTAQLPHITDRITGLRIIEIKDTGPILLPEQRRRWERNIVLEATQTGSARIDGLTVELFDLTSGITALNTLQIEPFELSVTTVLPDDIALSKPRGPGLPLSLPRSDILILWILATIVAIAVVAGFALPAWQRRHYRTGTTPSKPDLDAGQAALAAINGLSVRIDMSTREIEAFHETLASILRRYLQGNFGLDALRKTTQETVAALGDANTAIKRSALAALLNGCDLVKFARVHPDRDTMQRLLESAEEFVIRTAQVSETDKVDS